MRYNLKIYSTEEMVKSFYQKIILMGKDSILYENLTFGNVKTFHVFQSPAEKAQEVVNGWDLEQI